MIIEQPTLCLIAGNSVELANDWAEVGMTQYRTTSSYRWDVETYLSTQKLRPRVVCESDDALVMLEVAQRGGYIAFVPKRMAREAPRVREGGRYLITEIDAIDRRSPPETQPSPCFL